MTAQNLLDRTTLQNLVDLDDGGSGLLREMIDIFREDTPRRVRDILGAVSNRDADALSRAAHALKGGAGALGAEALRTLGAELEHFGRDGALPEDVDLPQRLEALFADTLAALEAHAADIDARH